MADGKGNSKNSPSSFVEIFGRKDAGRSSGSSSSYFSNVLPPVSSGMTNDSPDLYRNLNKHKGDGSKSQGSPTKKSTSHNKDGKPSYNESTESAYFGSSVHYGGRDFYTSSSGAQPSGSPKKYKGQESDDFGNSNAATRGEWWQGSLYY